MTPGHVESMIFLKGSYDLTPLDIIAIASKDVESAISLRLRDAKKRAEVHDMDCGIHVEASLDELGGTSDNGGESSDGANVTFMGVKVLVTFFVHTEAFYSASSCSPRASGHLPTENS